LPLLKFQPSYIQVQSPSVLGSVATASSSVNTKFLAVLYQEFVYHWSINCRVLWPWKWWKIMRKKGVLIFWYILFHQRSWA